MLNRIEIPYLHLIICCISCNIWYCAHLLSLSYFYLFHICYFHFTCNSSQLLGQPLISGANLYWFFYIAKLIIKLLRVKCQHIQSHISFLKDNLVKSMQLISKSKYLFDEVSLNGFSPTLSYVFEVTYLNGIIFILGAWGLIPLVNTFK